MESVRTRSRRAAFKFSETDIGMLSGVWPVAEEGYVWSEDIESMLGPSPPGWSSADFGGPWLHPVPGNDVGWNYPILREPGLPRAFYRLSVSPSTDAILKFANHYGTLTRGVTIVRRDRQEANFVPWAEPYGLWARELAAFKGLYETWTNLTVVENPRAYSRQEVKRADDWLRQRARWTQPGADGPPLATFNGVVIASGWESHLDMETFEDTHPLLRGQRKGHITLARVYLLEHGANRLKGAIDPMFSMPLGLRFFPRDLISAIYLLFAIEVMGRNPNQRECLNPRCPNGGLFFPKRRDQKYCDGNCRSLAGYYRHQTRKGA